MVDHLLHSMLYLGTHTAYLEAGVGAGLAIYPRGTFTQCCTGTVQRRIHCPKVCLDMRIRAWFAATFTQVIGQRLCGAVPAGGDPRTAVPETGARKVLPWLAYGDPGRTLKGDFNAGGRGHTHCLPVIDLQALGGVGQFDRHQLRLVIFSPGSDQRTVDLQGT
ncbi:hypothetical protein D3C81_1317710 [compost metagenome]